MKAQEAYNEWSGTYDSVANPTRDLEARVLRQTVKALPGQPFGHSVEAGCGTGKNTAFLASLSTSITAADFSEGMLREARRKATDANVTFRMADLTQPWTFDGADLIVCSLVLEHIEDLHHVCCEAFRILTPGGHLYICELHPYKQWNGSVARFEKQGQEERIETYIHSFSDYTEAALQAGFGLVQCKEWWDEDAESARSMPRLLSFVFQKP